MKRFPVSRQKLTINRIPKGQNNCSGQIGMKNGVRQLPGPYLLPPKDNILVKQPNSSIFKKQTQFQKQNKLNNYQQLIRCKSISCIVQNNKIKHRIIPKFPKLMGNTQNNKQKLLKYSMIQQSIEPICESMIQNFKQKGLVNIQNNQLCFNYKLFLPFIAQIIEKVLQETYKYQFINIDNSSTKQRQNKSQRKIGLSVYNQLQIKQILKKIRNIEIKSNIIDYHLQHVSTSRQKHKQQLWKVINIESVKSNHENVINLLDKLKCLNQQITQKQAKLKLLDKQAEDFDKLLLQQKQKLQQIQKNIRSKQLILQSVQKQVKEIQNYIYTQPNKILLQQAQGYKQSQQQLFDLAFLYEQQTPSSVASYIQESILIPSQNFKLTINSCYQNFHQNITTALKNMDTLKNNLKSAYDFTIEKLSQIIDRKINKIKKFVGIMRRLASYTIGKRQYLDEINKKMAIISINGDKLFQRVQQEFHISNISINLSHLFQQLKQLFKKVKITYCEAELFY